MLVPDSAVAGGEQVQLLDFGIAKLVEAGAHKDGDQRARMDARSTVA